MSSPFSMGHFIRWLENHPGDKQYNYGDRHSCLMCQYVHGHKESYDDTLDDLAHGTYRVPGVPFDRNTTPTPGTDFMIAAEWCARFANDPEIPDSHTFGKCLSNARKLVDV